MGMNASGSRAEFDRLVREHLPMALRLAIRLTGRVDLAEDVVQEAMLRATKGWKRFRRESSFQTWLYRIVVNTAFSERKKKQYGQLEDCDWVESAADGPAQSAACKELGDRVAELVAELPPRQRSVLVLSAYEGMESPQIAEVLNISDANVYANLYAARKRLRQQLTSYVASNRDE